MTESPSKDVHWFSSNFSQLDAVILEAVMGRQEGEGGNQLSPAPKPLAICLINPSPITSSQSTAYPTGRTDSCVQSPSSILLNRLHPKRVRVDRLSLLFLSIVLRIRIV